MPGRRSPPLAGRVVVVPVDWDEAVGVARGLGSAGATVVLVGADGDAAGRLAAALEADGTGRPAVFVSAGSADDVDALVGFVTELFPPGPQPEGGKDDEVQGDG